MNSWIKSIALWIGILGVFSSTASAEGCFENRCGVVGIGIGGIYANLDSGASAKAYSKGGYIAASGGYIWSQRFKAVADFNVGALSPSFSG